MAGAGFPSALHTGEKRLTEVGPRRSQAGGQCTSWGGARTLAGAGFSKALHTGEKRLTEVGPRRSQATAQCISAYRVQGEVRVVHPGRSSVADTCHGCAAGWDWMEQSADGYTCTFLQRSNKADFSSSPRRSMPLDGDGAVPKQFHYPFELHLLGVWRPTSPVPSRVLANQKYCLFGVFCVSASFVCEPRPFVWWPNM